MGKRQKVTKTLFDCLCGHDFFLVKDGIANFETEAVYIIRVMIHSTIYDFYWITV